MYICVPHMTDALRVLLDLLKLVTDDCVLLTTEPSLHCNEVL